MRTLRMFVMGIVLLGLSPFLVSGQGMMDPVSFQITEAPENVQAGASFDLTLDVSIEGNWHLYSINNDPDKGPIPTTVSVKENNGALLAGEVQESEPEIAYDPNFDVELGWHAKNATFTVPVAISPEKSGNVPVEIDVRYMVCDDHSCLPPKTKTVTYLAEVSGVADQVYKGFDQQESGTSVADQPEESEAKVQESSVGGEGFFSFFWIALTAGFAALLTPCVFPMIPLTVSYFAKQSHGSRRKAFGEAMLFGLAIIATFTLLGVLLSIFIGASGANQFASNPWVNLFIGLVLVVFAISLLGLFELRLPYQLTNWLNRKSNESGGWTGLLFMGLTISAVSFSCTAPFVGGVLAATTGGEWFYPILGMVGFSAAFASPFVLFAVFPSWLESLPQSGSWMNLVKVLLGFIELAAAFKFISNADLVWEWGLVSRPFTIAAWIVIFALAGLYTLGFIGIGEEKKPKRISTLRLLVAIPLLTFSFYLIPGLLGASLGIWDSWLPPKQATDVSVVHSISQQSGGSGEGSHDEGWTEDYDKAVAQAKESGKPVFIDFTGYTCTNCRAMETNVFPREDVQERFNQMEKVRLYTDDGVDGPENQKFQFKLTGTVALPTYVIVDPKTEQVVEQLVGYTRKDAFVDFLDDGLEHYENRKKLVESKQE